MIGYTDEQNYKDIADSIRDLTGESEKVFTPAEMPDFINNIDKSDFEKFKVPVIVFSNVSNYDVSKGTKKIYSTDLTSTNYTASTVVDSTEKLLYTQYTEDYKQQAWEWDEKNATVDNPEVFRKSTMGTVSTPRAFPLVEKHKLKGHIEIFANNLPNGHHLSQDLEFNDEDKIKLILPTKNYVQLIDVQKEYDSNNSLWTAMYENNYLILTTEEKELLISESVSLTNIKEYYRKNKNDIYCYEIDTGYCRYLPTEYDDEEKSDVSIRINDKVYKKLYSEYPCYVFYYKSKSKYKIARKEDSNYYECNEHGTFDEGFIRVQGDASLKKKKHNWKFKLKKKVKLFQDWASSKSYIIKAFQDHDLTYTLAATDMLYTLWREMTDERNTHQNEMSMKYFDGNSIVDSSFTDYIEMGLKYHETVAYLKENGTEEELKIYKENKPLILNYVESEGKGTSLTAPCILFWENDPSLNLPNKYTCHGLYQIKIPLCDKTTGYDEDDDLNFCMFKSASFPTSVNGTTNFTSNLYATTITESARSNNSYLREVNPIDNVSKVWSLNNIFFEKGEEHNRSEKIAAFNKMIDAVNDTTHNGQDWLEYIKKFIDVDSLIDSMILNVYFGENDHNSKNRFYWTDDVSKIGNGSVWHTGIDSYRYMGTLATTNVINNGNPFRLDRPNIGDVIYKYDNASNKTTCPDTTYRHVNSPNGIDQAFLRLLNDTDAVVKRFNQIKHLLQWEHTSVLFNQKVGNYLLGTISQCSDCDGNSIIDYETNGVNYYQKYVVTPNNYLTNVEYKNLINTGIPELIAIAEERSTNKMYSTGATFTSYYDIIKSFVYGVAGNSSLGDTESKKAMYLKNYRGILDYFYNRTEEMFDEQEKIDGYSRPAVFSVLNRMLFRKDETGNAIKEITSFDYANDYIDVFGLLDYKKPHWVTRDNLGGGEKRINGKFTPDQNNFKKYSNYKFNATSGSTPSSATINGFENIKILDTFTCEKLIDGNYIDAKSDIASTINGYITFSNTASGTYRIKCTLANNEYPMLKAFMTKGEEYKYNGLIKSNEVIIYVTDNDSL